MKTVSDWTKERFCIQKYCQRYVVRFSCRWGRFSDENKIHEYWKLRVRERGLFGKGILLREKDYLEHVEWDIFAALVGWST